MLMFYDSNKVLNIYNNVIAFMTAVLSLAQVNGTYWSSFSIIYKIYILFHVENGYGTSNFWFNKYEIN